jgi:hypothetical protein
MDKANNFMNKAAEKINSKLNEDLGKFLYKIFNDILALLLVVYALLLVSEGVIPGLASAHLSFTRLTLIVFAVLGMITYLGKINGISFESGYKKTALFGGLMAFSILLIINSLLKFAWLEIGIITIASILLLYYLYKNIRES